MENIKDLFERIIEDGVITDDEYQELMDQIHKDGEIDAEESTLISRMFKLIQSGEVKVINSELEHANRKREEEIRRRMAARGSHG